jgi:general secretion pathway protein M
MKLELLRRYWAERAPVERELLASIAFFAAAALTVLVLVKPALSAIARLERELPQIRERSARLQGILSEVRALKSRPAVAVGADARSALEQSLAAAELKADRVVPLPDGTIQLTFADVPYAGLSMWLVGAESALGMHPKTVMARATSTPGNADVTLEFRSGRE